MLFCAVDRYPDQPRFHVLPGLQLSDMTDQTHEHFLKKVVRIRSVFHLRQRETVHHIRISIYRRFRRNPFLFRHLWPHFMQKTARPHVFYPALLIIPAGLLLGCIFVIILL